MLMFTAQKYLYAAEISAALRQEFEQQGAGLKYGENALIPIASKLELVAGDLYFGMKLLGCGRERISRVLPFVLVG